MEPLDIQQRTVGPRSAASYPNASVARLLGLQSDNGAFVASPDFAQYNYCWLRDASFVAYALDRAGHHDAAGRYHSWVDRTIGTAGIGSQIDAAINDHLAGKPLVLGDMPPARFSLAGEAVADDDWPNFQIDGYGTWLWSLGEHLSLSRREELPPELRATVERTGRYLSTFAFEPCFDVWEENGGEIHTSTLASVYGGLSAAGKLLGDAGLLERADEVRNHLRAEAEAAGRYKKSSSRDALDASTLWLAAPFQVVLATDPYLLTTVEGIEAELIDGGGVRRYLDDTYFGGGAWPVLTCSLGWYHARAGRRDEAERCLAWTQARIDDEGRLAEQFGGEQRDPDHYRKWVARWGAPAADLLWSHAMHVVLCEELYSLPTARGATPARDGTS
jgi:GH15 family glucan-1,4-alpha-glucosidase